MLCLITLCCICMYFKVKLVLTKFKPMDRTECRRFNVSLLLSSKGNHCKIDEVSGIKINFQRIQTHSCRSKDHFYTKQNQMLSMIRIFMYINSEERSASSNKALPKKATFNFCFITLADDN